MLNTLVGIFFIFVWLVFLIYVVYAIIGGILGGVYIPTLSPTMKRMIQLAEVKPGQLLVDLGSGDGRLVISGALQGAQAVGYEINPLLVLYSRLKARLKGLSNASFHRTNFWNVHLGDVDVLTVYLRPALMPKLKDKVLQEMKAGSRVIVAVYPFPDWEPDARDGSAYCYKISK